MKKRIPAAGLSVMLIGCLMLAAWPTAATSVAMSRRVNAPHFDGPVQYNQAAIFWFGRVTSSDNYADVRIGYNDDELYVNIAIFDQRLWYDESPTAATLTNWDSVTLYLARDGNAGDTPNATSYRFDGQVNWWEDRADWQAAYQGSNGQWTSVSVPFTTTTDFRWESATVGGFNNDQNNRGWTIEYRIPFSSLGFSGVPSPGTIWGLGLIVHDRDSAGGSPSIPDTTWPEDLVSNQPSTWGQLRFGLPNYAPPPAIPSGTVAIRQGLNGSVVPDVAVGGTVGNMCPGDSDYIWNQWADFNDPHNIQFNVQNQGDISDWPCFAKYYVTFPLTTIPPGKAIISATLTLHQFGNPGGGSWGQPTSSFLQVLTIGQDWNEGTLTWNTAPLALENFGGAWVDPLPQYGGDPGIARNWDVSRAVAEMYRSGDPLRLAIYSADEDYQSGRYFWSSDHDDWHPEARPTLTVEWGEPLATVQQTAWPLTVKTHQAITYTLSMLGSGRALALTDALPGEVSAPVMIQVDGGGEANFDQTLHHLTWSGTPTTGQAVTITFPVTVLVVSPAAIVNRVVLTDALPFTSEASAIVLANPYQGWLPLLTK